MSDRDTENEVMLNPAWCHDHHARKGLVTNQNPDEPHDRTEPLASVSTCHRVKCIAKGTKYVAGTTNRQATFYDDALRRAAEAGA